jgi:site-specific recombinase XerD
MSQGKGSGFKVAQAWLDKHSSSTHTRRKYEAQFRQLNVWLVSTNKTLISVQPVDLVLYLDQLTQGTLPFDSFDVPKVRSIKTVLLARSVLRSLFAELVRGGLRRTNPIDLLPRLQTKVVAANDSLISLRTNNWIQHRKRLLETVAFDSKNRMALLRAMVIAELAYWVGLKRSEIANARMGDFVLMKEAWSLRVKRFGTREIEVIEVPQPVMQVISQYRLSRDLSGLPTATEIDIPVVVRLKSEKPLDPWTVANALQILDTQINDGEEVVKTTIISLRRTLIAQALDAHVSPLSLARHLRSKYAVAQMDVGREVELIHVELERLAA